MCDYVCKQCQAIFNSYSDIINHFKTSSYCYSNIYINKTTNFYKTRINDISIHNSFFL